MLRIVLYDENGNPNCREVTRKEFQQLEQEGVRAVKLSENYAGENVIYPRRVKAFTKKCAFGGSWLIRCAFGLRDREKAFYCSSGCLLEGQLQEAGYAWYEAANRVSK